MSGVDHCSFQTEIRDIFVSRAEILIIHSILEIVIIPEVQNITTMKPGLGSNLGPVD